MITMDDYPKIKRKVEAMQREADQAIGAINQLLNKLKEKGCENKEQAKQHLEQLKEEEQLIGKKWVKALEAFKKQYPEVCDESEVDAPETEQAQDRIRVPIQTTTRRTAAPIPIRR